MRKRFWGNLVRHRCGWTPDEFIALGYSVIYVYAGAFLVEKRIN